MFNTVVKLVEKLDSKIEFWCIYMGGILRGGYRNSLGTPGGNTRTALAKIPLPLAWLYSLVCQS